MERCDGGGVEVIVGVDVIGPVIVAVHVHGNDTPDRDLAVDATSATLLTKMIDP